MDNNVIYRRENGENIVGDPLAIESCKNEQNRDIIDNARLGSYDKFGNYIIIPSIKRELLAMPKLVYGEKSENGVKTYELKGKIPVFGDVFFKLKFTKSEAVLSLVESVYREANSYLEIYDKPIDSLACGENGLPKEIIFRNYHITEDGSDFGKKEGLYDFTDILTRKVYLSLLSKELKKSSSFDEHAAFEKMVKTLKQSGEYGKKILDDFASRIKDRPAIFEISNKANYEKALNDVLLSSLDVKTSKEDKENFETNQVYLSVLNARNENIESLLQKANDKIDENYVRSVVSKATKDYNNILNQGKNKNLEDDFDEKFNNELFASLSERKQKTKRSLEKPILKQGKESKDKQKNLVKPKSKQDKIKEILDKNKKETKKTDKKKKLKASKSQANGKKKVKKLKANPKKKLAKKKAKIKSNKKVKKPKLKKRLIKKPKLKSKKKKLKKSKAQAGGKPKVFKAGKPGQKKSAPAKKKAPEKKGDLAHRISVIVRQSHPEMEAMRTNSPDNASSIVYKIKNITPNRHFVEKNKDEKVFTVNRMKTYKGRYKENSSEENNLNISSGKNNSSELQGVQNQKFADKEIDKIDKAKLDLKHIVTKSTEKESHIANNKADKVESAEQTLKTKKETQTLKERIFKERDYKTEASVDLRSRSSIIKDNAIEDNLNDQTANNSGEISFVNSHDKPTQDNDKSDSSATVDSTLVHPQSETSVFEELKRDAEQMKTEQPVLNVDNNQETVEQGSSVEIPNVSPEMLDQLKTMQQPMQTPQDFTEST